MAAAAGRGGAVETNGVTGGGGAVLLFAPCLAEVLVRFFPVS